jgi:hypothetical protein
MTAESYLAEVLKSQRFGSDDEELKTLRAKRDEVEKALRNKYGSKPTIRYGGSHAKNTMIKASYDLDILCYFNHGDTTAGKTLEEIYTSAKETLATEYSVEERRSALRLKSLDKTIEFHIDVVAGRFVDDDKSDVFLYQADGDKCRLKTNPDLHISHIKASGHADIIALMKYWRYRAVADVKTFVLELAVINALVGSKAETLEGKLTHVFKDFRDSIDTLEVTDPANPTGNDLSAVWNADVRDALKEAAKGVLTTVDKDGWEKIFGKVETKAATDRAIRDAVDRVRAPTRPWAR